jgi:exopolysaccharide production protein ExoZ
MQVAGKSTARTAIERKLVSTHRRLQGIQYLRAVAAVMVVSYHVAVQIPAYTPFLEIRSWFDSRSLGAGIHIFFVISGFIMMATTGHVGAGEFIRRRLIRIVPLYWLLTSAVVIGSYLHYFKQTQVTTLLIIKSLLFVPFVSASGRVEPLLVPGWTLNVEMFFYATFAIAIFVSSRHRMKMVGIFFIALVLGGRVLTGPTEHPALWLLTRDWMLEFCTGMLIGHLYLRKMTSWPVWVCGALVAGGFALLLSSWLASESAGPYVLPATAIVLGVVAYESRCGFGTRRVGVLLGDASYAIYLSHLFVLACVTELWKQAGLMIVDWIHVALFAVVSLAAALGGALLVYRLLEKPMLHALSAISSRCNSITLFNANRLVPGNSALTALSAKKEFQ